MDLIEPYKITILVAGLTGLLLLIQILIVDAVAIMKRHTPGYPVEIDHDSFLFRATRVHANTNESVAAFVLFALFGIFSESNSYYLNIFSMVYFVGRVSHMIFYYYNAKVARSISFALSIIGLVGMFISGLMVWF
ncbi:MAG: hypothetical protein COA86_17595 [Kangiella sp.]|nr:MAG: hypothetical protein COA86_17595 [Kangiella sp.]